MVPTPLSTARLVSIVRAGAHRMYAHSWSGGKKSKITGITTGLAKPGPADRVRCLWSKCSYRCLSCDRQGNSHTFSLCQYSTIIIVSWVQCQTCTVHLIQTHTGSQYHLPASIYNSQCTHKVFPDVGCTCQSQLLSSHCIDYSLVTNITYCIYPWLELAFLIVILYI